MASRRRGGGRGGSGYRSNASFGPNQGSFYSSGGRGQHQDGGTGSSHRGSGNGAPGHQREPVDTRLCKFFLLGGLEKCQGGQNCGYSHALQRVADLDSGGRDGSGRPGAVKAVAAWNAPEGVKIFTGSKDGQIRMWNALSWKLENAEQLAGEVHCLDVCDQFLVVGYEGEIASLPGVHVGMSRVFNLTGGRVYDLKLNGGGGTDPTKIVSPGGPVVATEAADGYAHAQRVYSCVIRASSPTTLEVFTGGHEGEIHCWILQAEAPEFQLVARLDAVSSGGHVAGVSCLCFYRPSFLVSGGMDKTFRVWRIGSRAEPLANASMTPLECVRTATQGGHTDVVTCVTSLALGGAADTASLDQLFFITGSLDCSFRAWDFAANCAFDHTTASPVMALGATIDPAGLPILLVGLQDGSIELRHPQLGFKLRATLNPNITQGHRGEVRAITVGERYFCSGGADGHLMVYQWLAPLPPAGP